MAVQLWKVKRELRRSWIHILNIPRWFRALPDRMRYKQRLAAHEENFENLVKLQDGNLPWTGKIALFLVYQPKGIPSSVWYSLRYLREKGYQPFVVFNSAVSESDRVKMADHCWKMLERPNFGYDFGGYKDGLRVLRNLGVAPEQFIIMNDSIWFPMQGDPVADAEALLAKGVDVVGLNQDQKAQAQSDNSFIFSDRHIESYFYLMGPGIWDHPDFVQYWQQYRMNSDKAHTVRYGEIGFSSHLMAHGIKLEGLLRRGVFLQVIDGFDTAMLARVLEYAQIHVSQEQAAIIALRESFADTPEWAAAARALIARVTVRYRFDRAFPYGADTVFKTPYLKKNSVVVCHYQRLQYLRAVDDGLIAPPSTEILSELRAMVTADTLSPPRNAERHA